MPCASRQRCAVLGCPRPYNTYLAALQNLPPQALFLQALDADAADGVMQVLAAGIDLHAVRGVAGEPAVLDLLKEHVLLRAAHGGQKFAVQLGGGGNGATAGAQIKGKPLRQVLQDLVGAIDAFYA